MENDALISELKTVFLYHIKFFFYLKIKYFSTRVSLLAHSKHKKNSNQDLDIPGHSGLCTDKFECQKK